MHGINVTDITLDVGSGDIRWVIQKAIEMAGGLDHRQEEDIHYNAQVNFTFNEVKITVCTDSDPDLIAMAYSEARAQLWIGNHVPVGPYPTLEPASSRAWG